jgi:Ca2+-binding RTX toxin-like protein
VVVNSGEIGGDVIVQYGNVTVTNKGHIAGMVDGSSTDILKLTNNGTIDDHVTGAAGNDVLINTKLIDSYVDLGAGDNKITNSGTILASLDTGSGNDVINNTGHVGGEIRSGGGDDKITCGSDDDFIRDAAGNDVYSLGAGDDTVWGGAGNDIIDGGAGFDYFNGRPYGGGLSINLDSKAVIVTGHNLAASSLVMGGTVVTLKGFEEVHGSDFGDVIAGTAGHDRIMGNSGGDTIYGGGGGDDLYGGTSDSDIFVYLNVKDSGNTTATRDVIHDFDGAGTIGGDVIDLSGIDANTTKAGNDTFAIIGADKQFNHEAGELRWIHLLDSTLIQGDVNGDGVADFSIAVSGIQNFSANGDDFNP